MKFLVLAYTQTPNPGSRVTDSDRRRTRPRGYVISCKPDTFSVPDRRPWNVVIHDPGVAYTEANIIKFTEGWRYEDDVDSVLEVDAPDRDVYEWRFQTNRRVSAGGQNKMSESKVSGLIPEIPFARVSEADNNVLLRSSIEDWVKSAAFWGKADKQSAAFPVMSHNNSTGKMTCRIDHRSMVTPHKRLLVAAEKCASRVTGASKGSTRIDFEVEHDDFLELVDRHRVQKLRLKFAKRYKWFNAATVAAALLAPGGELTVAKNTAETLLTDGSTVDIDGLCPSGLQIWSD